MAILDFEENVQYIIQELICINCKHRFISARPADALLKDLECPECGKKSFIIATGQPLDVEVEE